MKWLAAFLFVLALPGVALAAWCTMGWTNTAEPLPQGNLHPGGGLWDGKVITFAGYDNNTVAILDTTWIYDPDGDTWSAGDTVPEATLDFGFAVAEGYAYLVGGQNGSETYTDDVHEYDIDGDSWTTLTFAYPLHAWAPACAGGRRLRLLFRRHAGRRDREHLRREIRDRLGRSVDVDHGDARRQNVRFGGLFRRHDLSYGRMAER
ncbi:MAG: hypothetical protein M5R36_18290 [Deltaproteobacteria bacterium]|nr:hypothetical protein [Deltaproteobacteria bacterium]